MLLGFKFVQSPCDIQTEATCAWCLAAHYWSRCNNNNTVIHHKYWQLSRRKVVKIMRSNGALGVAGQLGSDLRSWSSLMSVSNTIQWHAYDFYSLWTTSISRRLALSIWDTHQSGGWGLKTLQDGPLWFQYFRQFKEKQWPSLIRHFCSEAMQ